MRNKDYVLVPTEDVYDGQDSLFTYNHAVKDDTYRSIYTYSNAFKFNKYEASQPKSPDRILANVCHYFLVFWSYILLVVTFPLTAWFSIKKVSKHERIVVFRLGRLQPVKGPGFVFLIPWIDTWNVVNILMRGFIIPPQQLILRDGGIVELGGEIRFQIEDVVKSVTFIQDLDHSFRRLGQTLLADILQQITIPELQTERRALGLKLEDLLKVVVKEWGVSIKQVELGAPKILSNATPGNVCSPLGLLMSSVQNMLQKPNVEPISLTSRIPESTKPNFLHDFMTNTALPALVNGTTKGDSDEKNIYKLEIEGAMGGHYWLDTKKGRTAAGAAENDWEKPDVTISLLDEDFIAIITSKMSPWHAYISGRLRVSGEVKLLYNIQSILKKLQTTFNAALLDQHNNITIV